MQSQRTGGMTAIAILNIVFGALGALVFFLTFIGGGLIAGAGVASGDSEVGTAVAAGGGSIMILGLVGLLCFGLLGVSGIGVLMLAPWGRTLSIAGGAGIALISVFFLATSGIDFMTIAFLAYGAVAAGLFFQSGWKAAFAGSTGMVRTPGTSMESQTDQYRHAA